MEEEPETPKIQKISVYTPIAYVAIILTVFIVFVKIYQKQQLKKKLARESLFDHSFGKDAYYKLASLDDPKPHDKLLKAAFLRKGSEIIRKTIKLKEYEPLILKLYVNGSINEEFYNNYKDEIRVQESELNSMVNEVESFKKGWTPKCFPLLQEITFNEAISKRIDSMDARRNDFLEIVNPTIGNGESTNNDNQAKGKKNKKK
ncbi:Sec63 complex subunit SEC66 ASCRUDRAFT_82840 [Ascoidea rubescens DSM 1968]|uniref:Translocation protein SEC66 n=1 Tax=Ascoidea rubescens DSM 1968 TaxID=1344418 RepID=A0A1D2VAK8_9ASCO|nr:hypothetical protein ASCRUDRAFT_82840 [Ascoidea rubescens DSM 1968]ODV58487.1 hypothetical protein ASCRUDRAFT_82840 [Ascoidea rubescens DSM 1968]